MPVRNYMIAHKENKYFHPQKHTAHSKKISRGFYFWCNASINCTWIACHRKSRWTYQTNTWLSRCGLVCQYVCQTTSFVDYIPIANTCIYVHFMHSVIRGVQSLRNQIFMFVIEEKTCDYSRGTDWRLFRGSWTDLPITNNTRPQVITSDTAVFHPTTSID